MSDSNLRSTRWLSVVCFSAMIGLAVLFFLRTKWREEATARAVAASKAGESLEAKPNIGKKQGASDVALASATVDIGPDLKPDKKPVARRRVVTPVEALDVAPGFRVELVRAAKRAEGSWICLTKDNRGRLIISGQPGQAMIRATLANGEVEKWEQLELPLSGAMGALYAYDSLYLTAEGQDGYGIFRCRDTNGDDQYDEFKQLADFNDLADQGTREHGPHGLELGPDGKIYCVIGNRTAVLDGISPQSPHRNHQEDVLPAVAAVTRGRRSAEHYPGGHIVRFNAEGTQWELVAGGLRNSYDLAFNADGECFTFDNDTEADWGMPWYRPARVNHCVSGAEFGTRPKFGTWPAYFEDAVPPIGEVGLAAPTGMESGEGTKFPAKYQRAIYLLDWANGRILAMHLQPQGASYDATWENFVTTNGAHSAVEQPFNVTDVTVGEDGALYFVVGGRHALGALYRVVYTGSESTERASLTNDVGATVRNVRQRLERLHGQSEVGAVERIWPHLGSEDHAIRYAARLALESQPLSDWQTQALVEKDPLAQLNALLALTRVAPATDQPAVQQALADFPLEEVDNEQKLIFLRVCAVNLSRHLRQTTEEFKSDLIAKIEPLVPTPDENLNREAMRMLIFLEAPSAVAKGLALISDAKTLQDQMFYLMRVRSMRPRHWTLDQRREFLKLFGKDRPLLPSEPQLAGWFREVDREFTEGASFYETMTSLFWDYVNRLPESERKELEPLIQEVNQSIMPRFDTPAGLPIVRTWTIEEVAPLLERVDERRTLERGRTAFINAQCVKCHRCGSAGGSSGPDLTTIARRFDREQILQSILSPSNVVSDQYEHTVLGTTDGRVVVGRIVEETSEIVLLQTNPLSSEYVEIQISEIEHRAASKMSPMPEHLIDVLHEEEILDLIAYLESGGSKSYAAFQRSAAAEEE